MKVCCEIKEVCVLVNLNCDIQMVAITNVSLTSDFKVTRTNYEHITSVFHSPPFWLHALLAALRCRSERSSSSSSLGGAGKCFLTAAQEVTSLHTSRCHQQYSNISNLNLQIPAMCQLQNKVPCCLLITICLLLEMPKKDAGPRSLFSFCSVFLNWKRNACFKIIYSSWFKTCGFVNVLYWSHVYYEGAMKSIFDAFSLSFEALSNDITYYRLWQKYYNFYFIDFLKIYWDFNFY